MCADWKCVFRLLLCVAWYLHRLQGYFIPSWTFLIWVFRLPRVSSTIICQLRRLTQLVLHVKDTSTSTPTLLLVDDTDHVNSVFWWQKLTKLTKQTTNTVHICLIIKADNLSFFNFVRDNMKKQKVLIDNFGRKFHLKFAQFNSLLMISFEIHYKIM